MLVQIVNHENVRNPYDAIIADFKRQNTHSHTANIDYSKFKGAIWEKFSMDHAKRWPRDSLVSEQFGTFLFENRKTSGIKGS